MLTFSKRPAREPSLDRRGYYRSPVTLPSYRRGQPSPNLGKRFPIEVLSPEEVDRLLTACGRGPAGLRNRAIIVTQYRGMLRCAESLALYPKDVDLVTGRVMVLHGKGDKSRVSQIGPTGIAVIERWIRERQHLGLTGRQPLFCVISKPTFGLPVHDAYVRELLKRLAVKAGIEKRVHPHGLRHSGASYLLDQGVPIHYIRRMLGHSSIAVTERYADHVNPSAVLSAIRELPWPAGAGLAAPAVAVESAERSIPGRASPA